MTSVSSGVTSSGLTISSGGQLVVLSGGTVESSTILSGGSGRLLSGGVGKTLTVSAGGVLDGPGQLEAHNTVAGTVSGVTVSGTGSTAGLVLLSGGVASNVSVTGATDFLQIEAGASATGTVLTSHGYDEVFGSATSTTVNDGCTEYVSAGGETISATVLSGGTVSLDPGAIGDVVTV